MIEVGQTRVSKTWAGVVTGGRLIAYPYLLMLEQSNTEAILTSLLERLGHAVERTSELVALTDTGGAVTATVRNGDGAEEVIQASCLVGSDGAHSIVRHALGVPFAGKTYEQSLFVLDCEVRPQLPYDEMSIVFSEGAFTGFFPLTNGRSRVLGTLPPGLEGHDTITFPDVATDFAQRVKLPVRLENPAWISLYHSHHRVVSTFRKGRCFLAGDAAHIHSPVGAQGMNTGLQDAYNLAWKLALVVQGRAKPALLDTYHEERIEIATRLVRTTDRAFNYVNNPHPLLKAARLRLLPIVAPRLAPIALRQRVLRELVFRTISQIGIHYRDSALSKEAPGTRFPRTAPRPGERVPYVPQQGSSPSYHELVSGTTFHLALFSGTAESTMLQQAKEELAGFTDLIECHEMSLTRDTRALYQAFGMRQTGFYLIRPDQYVAYRGHRLDGGLRRYLQAVLS